MHYQALENMLNCLGRELFKNKEHITIDLLGSAALVLGYQCWPSANDVDARWSDEDSFVLKPLIAAIGNKFKHPKDVHWMNTDISDIVYQEGTWSRTVSYGYLNVRIPSPEFMMSILVGALHACDSGNTEYPPFGKAAAQCKALADSQCWDKNAIVHAVEPFFPRGISPACDEWLNRIFLSNTGSAKRLEMLEP